MVGFDVMTVIFLYLTYIREIHVFVETCFFVNLDVIMDIFKDVFLTIGEIENTSSPGEW